MWGYSEDNIQHTVAKWNGNESGADNERKERQNVEDKRGQGSKK